MQEEGYVLDREDMRIVLRLTSVSCVGDRAFSGLVGSPASFGLRIAAVRSHVPIGIPITLVPSSSTSSCVEVMSPLVYPFVPRADMSAAVCRAEQIAPETSAGEQQSGREVGHISNTVVAWYVEVLAQGRRRRGWKTRRVRPNRRAKVALCCSLSICDVDWAIQVRLVPPSRASIISCA